MDHHDALKIRQSMQSTIFSKLQKRNPSPIDDASKAIYMDVARRLEEYLYKLAVTKEGYLNLSTLDSRLTSLIKGRKLNNYNQIQRNANSSSLGTMITTNPEVSAEITMDKEKLVENGDQQETDCRESEVSEPLALALKIIRFSSLKTLQDYIAYVTRKNKIIFAPMVQLLHCYCIAACKIVCNRI